MRELSQVMIRKEGDTEEAVRERKRYYEQIGRMHSEVCKWVTFKNTEKCIESIDKIEEFTGYAFDVAILKEVYALQGQVSIYFGEWTRGVEYFKKYVRDVVNVFKYIG